VKILYALQAKGCFSGNLNTLGGRTAHVVGVVEALRRLRHEILFVSFEPLPKILSLSISQVRFRPINDKWPLGWLRRQWLVTMDLISIIREQRPHLLYVRWSPNVFFGCVRRRFPDLAIALECNTPQEMSAAKPHRSQAHRVRARLYDRAYVRSATVISAVSQEVRDFLLAHHSDLSPDQIIVNPNGVDTERFQPCASDVRERYGIPADTVVVGFAGNFRQYHRIDLLIDAVQQIEEPDVRALIVGTGPPEIIQAFRSRIADVCKKRFVFTGAVPFAEMPAHLAACDILMAPRDPAIHGSPIKLFEYMAVGKVVAAARVGQQDGVIQDGVNGCLFEPTVEGACEVLRRLAVDPALRARLGAQARADAVEKHSWERNVTAILDAMG